MAFEFFFETAFGLITWQQVAMIGVGCVLLYLAIFRKMEPLLLGPIGFAAILANLSFEGITGSAELMAFIYDYLISTNIFSVSLVPLFIFFGIGAMTDFSPLIADPKTFLLGAAAQIGIYGAMLAAIVFGFNLHEAATIGIIGGADGPTTIFTATQLAPDILGAVAVAAYSYMALVPIIQPPVIKALTTKKQRMVRMETLREVRPIEKLIFPVAVTIVVGLLVPSALALIGMLMFGNLLKVSGVMDRLSKAAQNEIINGATVALGLGVGYMMTAERFLKTETVLILLLGVVAFIVATAGGVLLGQLFYRLSGGRINPMIGAAGVSAVPMSARVVQRMAKREDPENFLLMHAMGPNVAGVIGSAVAAGVFIGMLG
ncbi:MAG: sodium ion-translocating decarboxylase subunit beta [Candidatus Thermoplasmatota archaeon]|nr:sodium ion-translocating decarboxylase subunit beta [Candidatus Thermoplasmatota archaeon]